MKMGAAVLMVDASCATKEAFGTNDLTCPNHRVMKPPASEDPETSIRVVCWRANVLPSESASTVRASDMENPCDLNGSWTCRCGFREENDTAEKRTCHTEDLHRLRISKKSMVPRMDLHGERHIGICGSTTRLGVSQTHLRKKSV